MDAMTEADLTSVTKMLGENIEEYLGKNLTVRDMTDLRNNLADWIFNHYPELLGD